MDLQDWSPEGSHRWRLPPRGAMAVPVVALASEALLHAMEEGVRERACWIAQLPGITGHVALLPHAHGGDGFPIGAVAGFDAQHGGVVSPGGVGFDVACGVRCLLTGLRREQILESRAALEEALAAHIPAGISSPGGIPLIADGLEAMLRGGARWAVEQGWGYPEDLLACEHHGHFDAAEPAAVSERAKQRLRHGLGTLGSGNHALEVQWVAELWDGAVAQQFGLALEGVVVLLHGGSRGLGHQVSSDYLELMAGQMAERGLALPQLELAYAPIGSELGQRYLGAMQAAANCAFANRQILTQLVREVFAGLWPEAELRPLVDLSHNLCSVEDHLIGHDSRRLHVHRRGATRAHGPGHGALREPFCRTGQPVLIAGATGTGSTVLAGLDSGEALALSSASHGAGSSPSEVEAVALSAERAGLARRVARLEPLLSIKG